MSIDSQLDIIISELHRMLNNKLGRINPIFRDEPGKDVDNGHFFIQFPEFLGDFPLRVNEDYRPPQLMWFIFKGLILRSSLTGGLEPHEQYELVLRKDCPIHVDCVIESVRKHSRKNLILIQDDLPEALVIDVETGFKPENERESLIRSLANGLLREGKNLQLQIGVQRIINSKELTIRASVQKLLDLAGLGVQGDFSYCLTCGSPIDELSARREPNLFCVNPAYANPNTCRNVFRYRQTSRLKLTSSEERKKHALSLYSKLQEIINSKPVDAFEELQKKHPKLYSDGRKSRPTSMP